VAETTDLPTRFVRIVVTDDRGRYLVPDLPKANYNVFVRGYGLVDSPRVKAAPGKTLNLTAVPAPDQATAAEYYPPIYWFAMLHVPAKSKFPGYPDLHDHIRARLTALTAQHDQAQQQHTELQTTFAPFGNMRAVMRIVSRFRDLFPARRPTPAARASER